MATERANYRVCNIAYRIATIMVLKTDKTQKAPHVGDAFLLVDPLGLPSTHSILLGGSNAQDKLLAPRESNPHKTKKAPLRRDAFLLVDPLGLEPRLF